MFAAARAIAENRISRLHNAEKCCGRSAERDLGSDLCCFIAFF
jgi:hypothetical protein